MACTVVLTRDQLDTHCQAFYYYGMTGKYTETHKLLKEWCEGKSITCPTVQTINNWVNHRYSTRTRGRKTMLTKSVKRHINYLIRSLGGTGTLDEIYEEMKRAKLFDVCKTTLYKWLGKMDSVMYYTPKRGLRLTKAIRRRRVQWAKMYLDIPWPCVVFTDEKLWTLKKHVVAKFYTLKGRARKRAFKPKHDSGHFNTWCCIQAEGYSYLQVVDGEMTAAKYNALCKEFVAPYNFLLHDNAKWHVALINATTLHNMKIAPLTMPPYCSDINPAEQVWAALVDSVYKNGKEYATLPELEAAVQHAWKLRVEQTDLVWKLAKSMATRCNDLINGHGAELEY